jgi:hypothetical protein
MRLRWVLAAVLAVAVTLLLLVALWPPFHTSLRTRLIAALEAHFKSDVELASLDVSLYPSVTASGTGLIIKRGAGAAATQLISIDSFSIETTLRDLVSRSLHLRRVQLQGLDVHIPPRRQRSGQPVSMQRVARSELVIDEVVSQNGSLVIETDKPGGQPLVFEIQQLRLRDFAFDRPTSFETTLANPVPPGEVTARGNFGPWQPDEPRATPLDGEYTFKQADLGVFEGLAGQLSSVGTFEGQLERIAVEGSTTTPDFQLTKTGQPVRLDSSFAATIDGTNGDTILDRVVATVLDTTIESKGRIVKVDTPARGRLIEMDVRIADGKLEDILRLAIKTETAPMAGTLDLQTAMSLPPGEREVIERLALAGTFAVRAGQFASGAVSQKIADLSRRGRGRPEEPLSDRVFSNLGGSFRLENGRLALPRLNFAVSGAAIDLSGGYRIPTEVLNFRGTLRLDAKPSQTVTGFKSFLLRIADPLLKGDNAGTELPIYVRGTVAQPQFGVEIRKAIFGR